MSRNIFAPIPLVVLLACGQQALEKPQRCEDSDGVVEGAITGGRTLEVVAADHTVSGVAVHTAGFAIQRITVGGFPAEPSEFNFAAWKATLPIAELADKSGEDGRVSLPVRAVDACGKSFDLDELELEVDRTPEVVLRDLSVTIEIPGGRTYLPATGAMPAVVRVSANGEAEGAEVTLRSAAGTFVGSPKIRLVADGQGSAAAAAVFVGNRSGRAFIVAESRGKSAEVEVNVAAPPRLLPGTSRVLRGERLRVIVVSEADVVTCQATPAAGISVLSADEDLTATPGGQDIDDDGALDLDIRVDLAAAVGAGVIIRCTDDAGQSGAAEITVVE